MQHRPRRLYCPFLSSALTRRELDEIAEAVGVDPTEFGDFEELCRYLRSYKSHIANRNVGGALEYLKHSVGPAALGAVGAYTMRETDGALGHEWAEAYATDPSWGNWARRHGDALPRDVVAKLATLAPMVLGYAGWRRQKRREKERMRTARLLRAAEVRRRRVESRMESWSSWSNRSDRSSRSSRSRSE